MNKSSSDSILDAAILSLRELGLETRSTSDSTLTIRGGGRPRQYRVQIKTGIKPALVGPISSLFSAEDQLLVTDYVTPPLAETLRERGVQFVDAAGNTFLRRNGLLVFIKGQRSRTPRRAVKNSRVFGASGVKTIFALLSVPELISAPQREIARAAGVALGSVAAIFNGLRDLGYWAEVSGRRRLLHRERLTQAWTEAYARVLAPTLEIGRFSAQQQNWWRKVHPVEYNAAWGGETAAAVLQRHLVPQQAILYAAETPSRLLLKHRLKADVQGRVVVRRRFWQFDSGLPRPDVVPPLLIYADLMIEGDARSTAAAKVIQDAYLV